MISRIAVRKLVPVLSFMLIAGMHAESPPRLAGWGFRMKDFDAEMRRAAEVGFQVMYVRTDNERLTEAVEAGRKHGIEVYAVVTPSPRDWPKHFPDEPVPYQILTPEQDAAFRFLSAGRNRRITPYQWGGEPAMENEVLVQYRVICPSNQAARKLQKEQIDGILAIPGLKGIALDGYGYQNFRRCHCMDCERSLTEFREIRPELSLKDAEVEYFRNLLVDWINGLANHIRSRKPDAMTAIHIWPAFVPEPLYGNRLDVDFCGQTAAWFTLWPAEKIADYSRKITGTAKQYHARQTGVGMIGYYDKPGDFPVKEPALVDEELRIMLENGCQEVQVCDIEDVLNNAAVANVFQKHFGRKKQEAQ